MRVLQDNINVFCEKIVLKNFEKIHSKTTTIGILFDKNADLTLQLFKKKNSHVGVYL